VAAGLPGAPDAWLDPVDHVVAGFTARLASGAPLAVRPSPRRAVGPDLFALFQGAGGKAGAVTSAWLRVRRAAGADGALLPRPLVTSLDRQAPADAVELAWIDRALDAAGAVQDRPVEGAAGSQARPLDAAGAVQDRPGAAGGGRGRAAS
jgi:alkyldihydroxyacetonephosphate synthase